MGIKAEASAVRLLPNPRLHRPPSPALQSNMKFSCWATAATAVFSVLMSSAAAPSADVSPAAVPSVDAMPAAASTDGGDLSAQQVCTSVAQLTAMSSELKATVQRVDILNAIFTAPVSFFRDLSLSIPRPHSDPFTAANCSRPHRHCRVLSAASHGPSMPRSNFLRSIVPLNVTIDMQVCLANPSVKFNDDGASLIVETLRTVRRGTQFPVELCNDRCPPLFLFLSS